MDKVKVLFVDDEVKVLNSIRRSTLEEEFETFIAGSGERALEIMEENDISVLVTDMRMPGMDGLTLLKKVKEKYPDTIRMVLSGYNQLAQILSTINQVGVSKFITKPWQVEEEFLPAIRESVKLYSLKKEGDALKKTLENRNSAFQKILKQTNEMVSAIQNDVNNAKLVYEAIQKMNKGIVEKLNGNPALIPQLNLFNDAAGSVYNSYLDTIPSKVEEFSIDRILTPMSEEFSENIVIHFNENNFKYLGNFRTISFIVSTLFREIVTLSPESKLEAIVKTDQEYFSIQIKDIILSDLRTKYVVYMLNIIAAALSGSLSGDKEGINIKFSFSS